MAAYVFTPVARPSASEVLPAPLPVSLSKPHSNSPYHLFPASEGDLEALHGIFAEILDEGMTYPNFGPMDKSQFHLYFMSKACFVVRDAKGTPVAAFYIKVHDVCNF